MKINLLCYLIPDLNPLSKHRNTVSPNRDFIASTPIPLKRVAGFRVPGSGFRLRARQLRVTGLKAAEGWWGEAVAVAVYCFLICGVRVLLLLYAVAVCNFRVTGAFWWFISGCGE